MKKLRRVTTIILALALALTIGAAPAAAADSAAATTLRLAKATGSVTVKNAAGKSQSVKTDMRLYNGYTVATGKSSEAYISLDGTKAVKLDASSKGSVKKSGNKLEVCLDSGNLFFDVTAPLAANESLNIRTSTMVTGIRGSYGWVTRTEVGLMHGHVTLTCINPVSGETRVTELYSGERVYYDPASTAAGDPALKEIDFIKEVITNGDVPGFVVEEMRGDESLQTPVIEDVPSVDVPKLLEEYEDIRAAEEEAAAAEEAELAEQLAEQEEAITDDPSDYLFEEETDSGSGGSPSTGYAVTLPQVPGMVITTSDPVSGIAQGTEFHFHIAPEQDFVLYEEYLAVEAGDASVTLEEDGAGGYNASFIVSGNTTVTASGAVYLTESFAAAIAAFEDGIDYVELIMEDRAEQAAVIGETKTLILGSDASLSFSVTVTNNGTIVNNGFLNVDEGVLENYGTITNRASLYVEENCVLNNYSSDTLTNEGWMEIAGLFKNGDGEQSTAGRVVNESDAECSITATGSFYNNPYSIFENYGTLEVQSGQGDVRGRFYNYSSGSAGLTNNGSLLLSGWFDNGSEENPGSVVNANGAVFTISSRGIVFNNPSGTFENGGTLTVQDGGFFHNVSSGVGGGAGLTNGGSLTVEGDFYNGEDGNRSGKLNNSGTVSVSGLLTNRSSGEIVNNPDASITYSANSTRMMDNYGTITNNGSYSVYCITFNNGTFINNAAMLIGGGHNGSAEGGPFGPGTINNNAGATMTISGGNTFRNGGDGRINNTGAIVLSGQSANAPAVLQNLGMEAMGGGIMNTGTISIEDNGMVQNGTTRNNGDAYIMGCSDYQEIGACVITFDANGGSAEIEELLMPMGYSVAREGLPMPTRDGFEFAYWYKIIDGVDTPWTTDEQGEPVEMDITLYAKWN